VRRPRSLATAPQSRPAGALRLAALRLLGRRDYTTAELTVRLLDRGYVPEEVAATLARLTSEGALDDRRVARGHVRVASQAKGRGRLRIEAELHARGIDRDIAREALADLSADDDRRAIERFLARRQLLRRGFPADAISAVLKKPTSGVD
jgi:regulatory protein